MELISYDDFGRLRIRDFWPPETRIFDRWGIEGCIGYAAGEGVGFCHFLWLASHPGQVLEIRLENFGPDDCPDYVAEAIFKRLNLPLSPGMSKSRAIELLGEPVKQSTDRIGEFVRFRCGERWPYIIMCLFSDDRLGLTIVVREDMLLDGL